MRLVNIWAKTPGGTWLCSRYTVQLANDAVTAEPLGHRFHSVSGVQICYPVQALIKSVTMSFEVSGSTALSNLLNVISCGVLYLDGAVYPGQAAQAPTCDGYRGNCVIVSGNASVVTVSVSQELYQVSIPVTMQTGYGASGDIPYFAPLFTIASRGCSGVEIVQDGSGTPFVPGIHLDANMGNRLADGSMQLPNYTVESGDDDRVYVHFYVSADILPAGEPKILVYGIAGRAYEETDITHNFKDSGGWKDGTIGIGITGAVTDAYVRMQCGAIDSIYRLRIYSPNYHGGEAT